jgi:hypothetical protein
MKQISFFVIAALAAVPALAGQATYTFNVTTGAFVLDVAPNNFVTPDPVNVPVGGSFSVTITDNDGQLGPGDTFTLGTANLYNSEQKVVNFVGWPGTATFPVGQTKITNFNCPVPGVIGTGGVGTIDPAVYVTANFNVSGCTGLYSYLNGPWYYTSWRDVDVETFHLNFDIKDGVPVGVSLDGLFTYTYDYFALTFGSFAHSVQVQGTIVPEPATVALVALGSLVMGYRARRRRAR